MNHSLLNSICYTAGWFWCVLFGVHGYPLVAILGAVFLILFQLFYIKRNNIALYIQDVLLVLFAVPLGALLEIVFIQTGLIHYAHTTYSLPPLWVVVLYPLFALLLNHALNFLKGNAWICFLCGYLVAPLSYLAGSTLGAITFSYPLVPTLMAIGICWGLFLCLLTKIAHLIETATAETIKDRDAKPLKLLYDGECPLCNREICMLQKKDSRSKIKFIDISSKDFSPTAHSNIDYGTAMSEIHAVDGSGNLLIGVPAFAAVYARCQLLVTSTLFRLPFIKILLNPMYRLFAKNRLWITGRTKRE